MVDKNMHLWFSILMTWFILSAFCFIVSIISHVIDFVRTGSFQYLAVFILIPIVFVFVHFFISNKVKFDAPENYSVDYIDTNTYIESCATKWATENSEDNSDYILLVSEYENIANDLLKDIKWKNAWFERPVHHKEIMILDNINGDLKIYAGNLNDVQNIGQPYFWMYLDDFKKYFIIKNYGDSDASTEYIDS